MNTIEQIKTLVNQRIKELDEQIVDIYDSKAVLRKDELQKLLSRLSDLEKEEKPMNVDEYELVRLPTDCEIHTGWVEERDGQGFVSVPANMFADGEEVIVIINRKN